jgi:iron complex outermembrane receptor protein
MIAYRFAGSTVLAVLAGILVPNFPAAAQETDVTDTAANATLEEIVVTARRRNEDLQKVPIAITAMSAGDLRDKRVETVNDLQHFVPSLTALNATNRDSDELSIRGLPGVVAYFAEAPVVSALSAASSGPTSTGSGSGSGLYYDLQDIQVLKGPQSTLFGGTTSGGAILFEPKKPTGDYEGYVQATLGNYWDHELEGAINVPVIAEKLLIRMAGQTQQRDGFTEDVVHHKDLDNRDFFAGRVGVTIQPSDDVDNYLVYSSYYNHNNGTGERLTAVNPSSPAALAFGPAIFKALAEETALGPRATALDTNELGKEYTFRFVDTAQWKAADNLTIRNIAAYTESKYLFRWDLDGSSLPLIASTNPNGWSNNVAAYSEELQFQGKSLNDTLIWTAGGFLQFVHPAGYSYVQSIEFDIPLNTFIHNPLTTASHSVTREQALYAQANYDLGDILDDLSGLKVTGGYRYSFDYASSLQNAYDGLNLCQANPKLSVPNCANATDGNFSEGTWTTEMDYQVTPDLLLYATGRRGYNPGGFNLYAPAGQSRKYQPETVVDVEAGIKANWSLWDMPGRIALDGFHDHYTNIQRAVALVGSGINTITENAALATLEGIEFEGHINPIDSLELSGIYAYSNSRYDKYFSASTNQDLSGLPFTGGPRNQYSTTAKYTLPVADRLGKISLAATYSWQAHVQISDHELGSILPPHGLLDLRMDWNDIAGRPVDAAFFMTNATDQVYLVGGTVVYSALGVNPVLYGEPRMWGFQVRYRFGPGNSGL